METNTEYAGTSTINIGASAAVPNTNQTDWTWEKSKQEVNKLVDDIKIQNEKAKIERLEALKWLLGTEIPDNERNERMGTSDTLYKTPFNDEDIEEIKNKIMKIVGEL